MQTTREFSDDDRLGLGQGMRPVWMLALLASIPGVTTIFWWIGTRRLGSGLSYFEYLQFGAMLAAVVAGGYQLYFWVQRNNVRFKTRCLEIALDGRIPFRPRWIWLYSFLYYILIGLTVVTVDSLDDGVHLVFGGLLLLLSSTTLFYFFPTEIPSRFRDFRVTGPSTRFMKFVQSMDNERNAFPSMHCAVAMYVGLTLAGVPAVGPWLGYGSVLVVMASCLLVKQHVIVDTVAGVMLGGAVFAANEWLGWAFL